MKQNGTYDEAGVKYRYPERTCTDCLNYPCREDMDILNIDFAKYGCVKFKNKEMDD